MFNCSKISTFIQKACLVALLLCTLFANGWHVLILQGYGWSRMFLEYSKSLPTADAIELTFSGKEVCGICESVQRLQAACDETTAFWLKVFKLNLVFLVVAVSINCLARHIPYLKRETQTPPTIRYRPTLPPPRLVLV